MEFPSLVVLEPDMPYAEINDEYRLVCIVEQRHVDSARELLNTVRRDIAPNLQDSPSAVYILFQLDRMPCLVEVESDLEGMSEQALLESLTDSRNVARLMMRVACDGSWYEIYLEDDEGWEFPLDVDL